MNVPPLLAGWAVIVWGWQTGFHWIAFPAAILIESSWLMKNKVVVSARDFNRTYDFCVILFFVGMAISYGQFRKDALYFSQWIPLIFLPCLILQYHATENHFKVQSYFWLLRNRSIQLMPRHWLDQPSNFAWSHIMVCFLAASAANNRSPSYFISIIIAILYAFWFFRPRSSKSWVWGILLLFVAISSYRIQTSLLIAHQNLESKVTEWISDWYQGRNWDRTVSRTSMGSIGRLKQSNRIVLRVQPVSGSPVPILLREASYQNYLQEGRVGIWTMKNKNFDPVYAEADATTWILSQTGKRNQKVMIALELPAGSGVIPLPPGSTAVEQLSVGTMSRNGLGCVHVRDAPGFLEYEACLDEPNQVDLPPDEEDLKIPELERPALKKILKEIDWTPQLSEWESMNRIHNLFSEKFSYSLILKAKTPKPFGTDSALSYFLLEHRSGHCEFFAAATTLLLREMGIPARYAVGYAVAELQKSTGAYLVRERHAHAWCEVYVKGNWVDFDTTPASWMEEEKQIAGPASWFKDWLSGLRHEILKWYYLDDKTRLRKSIPWIGGLLLLYVAVRFFGRKGAFKWKSNGSKSSFSSEARILTPWKPVEQRLSELTFPRLPGETPKQWLQRVEKSYPDQFLQNQLQTMLRWHYQARFDPAQHHSVPLTKLEENAGKWLKEHQGDRKKD